MADPAIPSFDAQYENEDRLFDFDASGFPDLYGETGATATVAVVSGSGLTQTGGAAYDHTLKRVQRRMLPGVAGTTYLLSVHLVTTPNGYDLYGYAYLPVVSTPTG